MSELEITHFLLSHSYDELGDSIFLKYYGWHCIGVNMDEWTITANHGYASTIFDESNFMRRLMDMLYYCEVYEDGKI